MEDFNQLFDDHLFNIDKVEDKTSKLKEGERRMVSILFADNLRDLTNSLSVYLYADLILDLLIRK